MIQFCLPLFVCVCICVCINTPFLPSLFLPQAPLTYSNGRRKRDVGSDGLAFHPSLMLGMLSTLESAMEKFGRF